MRTFCGCAVVALLCAAFVSLTVAPAQSDASVPEPVWRDALGARTSLYPTAERAAALGEASGETGFPSPGEYVLRRPEGLLNGSGAAQSTAGAPGGRSWWPLLYSALIPGAGEISMGYTKRGVALVAAEAIAWAGYFVKRRDGLDKRDAYEAFADANWASSKWLSDHPLFPGTPTIEEIDRLGAESSGGGAWPGYNPWVSKAEDKQHYYENIGKYDWYLSGWADYDRLAPIEQRDTALRDQYRAMRIASNDALDTSNRFIYLSVVARVYSVIETLVIIHSSRETEVAGGSGDSEDNHWRLDVGARGVGSGHFGVEYNFR